MKNQTMGTKYTFDLQERLITSPSLLFASLMACPQHKPDDCWLTNS